MRVPSYRGLPRPESQVGSYCIEGVGVARRERGCVFREGGVCGLRLRLTYYSLRVCMCVRDFGLML